ncbi:unnamed protein product [Echinostoma caproni]|uniref:Serine/threonine-protein phosphatase n=1 Tax=Echinostoma caproni TaxID=27848 RepID=A0A183AMD5_9TREM|nr:unnamed protein product [Echinostoma caproni]
MLVSASDCRPGAFDEEVKLPLDESSLFRLLDVIIGGQNKLGIRLIFSTLKNAADLLEKQPNITEIDLYQHEAVAVCGDIHGNIHAILQFLKQNGMPSEKRPVIFNGDFVDRGSKSVEVLILVLTLFLTYPNCVFLNRGNHEDMAVNEHYGFKKEVCFKYPYPSTPQPGRKSVLMGSGRPNSNVGLPALANIVQLRMIGSAADEPSCIARRVIEERKPSLHAKVQSCRDGRYHLPIKAKAEALNAALIRLWQQILMNKEKIIVACDDLDQLDEEEIPVNNWADMMSEATGLHVPWRYLRPFLVRSGANSSTVKYKSLFEGTCVKHDMLHGQDELAGDLLRHLDALKSTAQLIDEDDTGMQC